MNADAVMFLDAVEFIDAAQTTIWQDQSSCLQVPIPSIFHCSNSQSFKKWHYVSTYLVNPVKRKQLV